MPESEEHKREQLAQIPVVEELESLVNVLGGEVIGVAVEAIDVVLEARGGLEAQQLDVVAAVPARDLPSGRLRLVAAGAVVRQPEPCARCCNNGQPLHSYSRFDTFTIPADPKFLV